MSGLNIKLTDLQISDFHAPERCFFFCDDILKKTFSFWGPTAAPRPPHHFPPFSLVPSPMSETERERERERGGGGRKREREREGERETDRQTDRLTDRDIQTTKEPSRL